MTQLLRLSRTLCYLILFLYNEQVNFINDKNMLNNRVKSNRHIRSAESEEKNIPGEASPANMAETL